MISPMKIGLIISSLFLAISSFAASVNLGWDYSCDSAVVGYKIYMGSSTNPLVSQDVVETNRCPPNTFITNKVYGTDFTQVFDAGNTNSYTVTNLIVGLNYYFAATTYDASGMESDFSGQAKYTPPNTNQTVVITNYVYLGMKIDYGTNFSKLFTSSIMMAKKDASIPYFYRSSLILTNRPVNGVRPDDSNNYLYLAAKLQYGTNFLKLINESYDLMCFTNPPANQFYRGKLVITNRAF